MQKTPNSNNHLLQLGVLAFEVISQFLGNCVYTPLTFPSIT